MHENDPGDTIRKILLEQGYAVLDLAYPDFLKVVADLGDIVTEAEIRLIPGCGRKSLFTEPPQVPFHTDHPLIDIAAWYCLDPGTMGEGDMSLVDGFALLDKFNTDECQLLKTALIEYPALDLSGWDSFPLLTLEPRLQVYFAPWLILADQPFEIQDLLLKFQSVIGNVPAINIPLAADRCVFVANHRYLHGREAVSADSTRSLRRVWIRFRQV